MGEQTCEAVFENGAFRPLTPLPASLREGQRVRLEVKMEEESNRVLDLASAVYEGLSNNEIDEIEEIALQRGDIFQSERPQ